MPKVVAFEIEIGGVKEIFNSFDEVKDRVKSLKKEFDSADFGSVKFKQSQEALAKLTKVQEESRKQTQKMKFEIEAANKEQLGSYRQLNAQLVVLRNTYKDLSEAQRDGVAGKKLIQDITLLDSKLKNIDKGIGLFQRNVGNYLGAINSFAAQAGNSLGGVAGNLVSGIGNIAGSASLGAPALFLALTAAAGSAVAGLVGLDAKISDLKVNIQKTAGLSATEVTALAESLKTLDTRTSLTELLNIGKVLGQFGIEVNTNTIKAIDKLNVALGDEFGNNAELITSVVGKLKNVFTEFKGVNPDEAFLKIGNALNELGATGAATAPIVADYATRLAGTLGSFKVSAGDILGVSATLEELGTNVERGATGFSRVLAEITKAPDAFVKNLKITDEVVKNLTQGTFTNFTQVVNKDLFQAFEIVISQIEKLNLSNTQTAAIFKTLGIGGQGEIEVLSKLAGAQELLRSRVETSNVAIQNSTGINKEFAQVNTTLGAELDKLKNSLENAFVNTGISGGITKLLSLINETQRSVTNTARIAEEEKIQFQALVFVATDVNTTQQRRIELIGELQKKYPEYFKNLKAEEVTNEKLIEILGLVNQKYNDKINLLALAGQASDAEAKKTKAQNEQFQAELKVREAILKAQNDLSTKYGFTQSNDIGKDIANIKSIFAGGASGGGFIGLANAIRVYESALKDSKKASLENFTTQIKTFQEFDKQLKTNKNYNEGLLIQIASFGTLAEQRKLEADQLEKLGKKKEAQLKLDNLSLDAKQLLKKVDIEQLKILKELADKSGNVRAGNIIGDALTGINKINTSTAKTVSTGSVSDLGLPGKASKSFTDFIAQSDNENKQYLNEKLKSLEKFRSIYLEKQIALIDSERQRTIEAEKKKAADQIKAIDETNAKLNEKQQENIDKVNADLKTAKGSQYEKLLKRRTELTAQYAKDDIEITKEGERAKQAIIQASEDKILEINKEFDKKEAERLKRLQADNLAGYNQYYKKLFDQVNQKREETNLSLLQDKNTKLKGSGGNAEIIQKINYEYDISGLIATENDLLAQIKITESKIKNAKTLNGVQALLGLDPVLSSEAIKGFEAEQKDLNLKLATAVEQRKTIEINATFDTNQKKLESQKQFNELVISQAFDLSNELAGLFSNNEVQRLTDEKDQRLSLLEEEYSKKLELAKGNANEEERVQAELSKKKIEIERKYQEEQKKIAKKQAIIAGALGVLQIFASPTPDIFGKLILAAALGIKTAFQIASIDKQKFAMGGIKSGTFGGRSHHYGGTKGYFEDGTQIEVEKDEDFVIINKRNSFLRNYYSGINSYKGAGRKFAEGGNVFGETLFRQSSPSYSQASGVAIIPEEQIYMMAQMVANATKEGTYQGAQSGIANGERINERYNEFSKRTNR